MKKLKIYLDTSVINFLFADDAPDFRKVTQDFFAIYAANYNLCISRIVILEISRTPHRELRDKLMNVIRGHAVEVLPDDDTVHIQKLAAVYMRKGIIPAAKMEDALHVAYATVSKVDILLSWNFKHLANVNKEARILAVNNEEGYHHPLRLLSPLEVENEK